ncbi:DUF3108 domain-containing protein [Candidatus Omnitrophota bacterium]
MRKIGIVFIILLSLFVYRAPYIHAIEIKDMIQRFLKEELPFKKGETLTYEVRYKKVKIGKSILTFHGEVALGDKKVYHVTFFTKIPAFKDTEDLYAEKGTFVPIEVHRSIKKRIGFNDRIEEKYDQENFRVDIKSKSKLRTKSFSIEKDSKIHNAILLTYYCRTIENFEENNPFNVTLPTLDFEVIYGGQDTIETALGEQLAHVFTSDPPKFKLWLSADERRIPLRVENPSTLGYALVIKSID